MIYRFKIPLVLFLAGFIFQTIGAWAKIAHQNYADKLLMIGLLTQVIGLSIAIIIIASSKKQG